MKMVRGRRKTKGRKVEIQCTADNQDDIYADAPKVKDSKLEFKGKLSHASPLIKEVRITNYFHQVHADENVESTEIISTEHFISISTHDSENLSDEVKSSKHLEDHAKVLSTPHKIQLQDSRSPLTPSTALSRLRISGSPKKPLRAKGAKTRRRLNISQSQNQINQSCNLKVVCCNVPNSKAASGVQAHPQPSSENHKLTEYFPVRRSERKPKRTILEERQRDLEEAILSGREEGLEVIHHFIGKGRGIVATRHFCKGEFVVEYAGELISMVEARDREKKYAQDQNTGCYMYYFKHHNQQYCVDATAETGRMGRLVNHSRNGNLMTKTVVVKNNPHLVLIAKEDIFPSDEILYDYGDRSKESIRHHPWLAM